MGADDSDETGANSEAPFPQGVSNASRPIRPIGGGVPPRASSRFPPQAPGEPDWNVWRNMPTVTTLEAVALSVNVDPAAVPPSAPELAALFAGRLKTLQRGAEGDGAPTVQRRGGELLFSLRDFVVWAGGLGWDMPKELTGVAAQTSQRQREPPEANLAERPLAETERKTLLKLIYGLAIKGYGYDPSATRQDTIREICSDLALIGLQVSDDTLRRKLKEAFSLFGDLKRSSE